MDGPNTTRFFLGANSSRGFCSLYDGFTRREDGEFLWVIKGGPGCGKSGFMRYIGAAAEAAGCEVEYILCSADPDSLDGVRIPGLGAAFADGTAPHILDPGQFGAGGAYIDVGSFCDVAAVYRQRAEAEALFAEYRALYSRAYTQLAGAGAAAPGTHPSLNSGSALLAALRRADGVAARELPRRSGQGRVSRRFISAISCGGELRLDDTVSKLCGRVYVLDNACGLAGAVIDSLTTQAASRGLDCILCPEPLLPERSEALLIPELSLGFLAVSPDRRWNGERWRHIRLDALPDSEKLRALRPQLREEKRLYEGLMAAAISSLAQAKAVHDRLEALYNPHVDFDGVRALAAEFWSRISSGV